MALAGQERHMAKRLQVYETPGITVRFDPNICTHSGNCIRGLPEVFDVTRRRWVRPELATPEAVAAQVACCPSGALQVQWPAGSGDVA
jgi:uncharacterized Fe-S cluster protein YjdI